MSYPQNRLGKFRSYAYHHILMVCNNTTTAEELVNTSEITTFQHPSDILRYSARQIGNDENSKYITLIDGTTDARFYITGASWENVIAMENHVGKGDIPQSTSMSLEGELEIVEPMGARFLNRLTKSCDLLSTDPVGLVFVLKTIFVGHNDDGTTETISDIKPLLFINYDITAIFDSSGARYKMFFVGASNGLGKMPHTQKAFAGLSFNVKPGDTLEDTFKKITKGVNDSIEKYQQQAKLEFAKTLYEASKTEGRLLSAIEATDQSIKFFDSNYRLVTYKITAPEHTASTYKAGDNEPVRIKNKRDVGSFNFGPDIGVEEIIKKVMASSTGVINDGLGIGSVDGKKYIYKIISALHSSNDEFVVEYTVKKYELAQLPYDAASKGETFQPLPGQSIEFDYIFTGKNVDIKDFDIKMEMGMAFFQIAATTDSLPNQETVENGFTNNLAKLEGSALVASDGKTRRSKTPLFLGSQMQQSMARNTRKPVNSSSFQALLNRHAALENIETKMTIYGNPQLLGEMQILPTDVAKSQPQRPQEGKTINPKWLSTPTLVKVNIKMPKDADDINTEYEDFWYTGFYSLFAVKQIFSDGVFMQELDMFSIPVADKLEEKTDDNEIPEVTKAQDEAFALEAAKILGFNVVVRSAEDIEYAQQSTAGMKKADQRERFAASSGKKEADKSFFERYLGVKI